MYLFMVYSLWESFFVRVIMFFKKCICITTLLCGASFFSCCDGTYDPVARAAILSRDAQILKEATVRFQTNVGNATPEYVKKLLDSGMRIFYKNATQHEQDGNTGVREGAIFFALLMNLKSEDCAPNSYIRGHLQDIKLSAKGALQCKEVLERAGLRVCRNSSSKLVEVFSIGQGGEGDGLIPLLPDEEEEDVAESPAPYAKSPAPYAESPAPYAKSPAPYAKSPAPYAKSPAPYAKSPAPYAESPAKPYIEPPAKPYAESPAKPYVEPHESRPEISSWLPQRCNVA
jgi:hypothetical protein